MASFNIRQLPLSEVFIDTLEKQNLRTCKDVLTLTRLELQALLGISYYKALEIQSIISKKCVSKTDNAYNLYIKQRNTNCGFFSLSLQALDIILLGGIPIGSITEISGPPGVGKSQFCFMLSVLATLPTKLGGLNGKVVFIDTESSFSAKRICEIAQKRFSHLFTSENQIIALLESIKVYKAVSTDILKEIVQIIENEVKLNSVKLVIIDSVASLMRKEFGATLIESLVERNQILLEHAATLKDIAQTHGIVVFLTNQITSHSSESDFSLHDDITSEEHCSETVSKNTEASPAGVPKKVKVPQGVDYDHVKPALGTTWAHCVNTRFVAQFLDSNIRQLSVTKSPVAPNASVRYILHESGILLTDDDIEFVNVAGKEQQNISTRNNFLTDEITGK